MTTIQITLPDELEAKARQAGLLSDEALQALLTMAIRRQAGQALLAAMLEVHSAGVPPMSMEEIDAEVKAVRAESKRRDAGGS